MTEKIREIKNPDRISSYFKLEKWVLAVISVSGILYNVGMTVGPWFEGKMAQCLCDIIAGKKEVHAMSVLAFWYMGTILFVQIMRFVKRLYVRKFANHINRDMKHMIYKNLVYRTKAEFETEETGTIMTKAISDVDACVEGMRKFTTEVFDTGVVMAAYLFMLFWYDRRLTVLSMVFPPIAYVIAQRLKKTVSVSAAAYKESAGRLNGAAFDRIKNALTYRVYGQEKNQDREYEKYLNDYEEKAVRANIWENSMQPLYQIISMMGVLVILWFGGKNVMGTGWTSWDIAAFTTFLSCFTKLAAKSSKAAKLFNAVQKASVSWRRIHPFLKEVPERKRTMNEKNGEEEKQTDFEILTAQNLSFSYPTGKEEKEGERNKEKSGENEIFKRLSFTAKPGEIIGVTGAVACGKSTFGRIFLCESPCQGHLFLGKDEFYKRMKEGERLVSYMGHQPELLNDTIRENILLGEKEDVFKYLKAVQMDQEVLEMPEREETRIGNGGVRLSGGQQARIALARALCHLAPIFVFDDPFSAVDVKTEREIMEHLREMTKDKIVFFISHRLTLFPELKKVFWMEDKTVTVSTHERLMRECDNYAALYQMQTGGGGNEA